MTYKVHVPGIMVQAKGLRGPKGDPGDITEASTYFQATSLMSNYADATHIHGSISGHNITATSGSNGLTLSVAALGAAANTLHAGDYVSMDVMGPSSTISITGLQPTGAYLTTAAGWDSVYQSAGAYLTTAAETNHTHGNFTTVSTAGTGVNYSSSSNGFTLAMPSFITTANETWHSHTDAMSISERSNYFYTSNNTFANSTHTHGSIQTSPFAGSNVSVSSASSGVTLSVPAFITTAPSLSHTHGNSTISGFNIAGTMLSNGLTLSVPNFVYLSNSTHFVNTTVSNSFVRSWELEGAHTAGTTGSLLGSILYLSGGDNITLSGNGNTIVISGNASGGTGGVAIGNTDSVGFSTGSVIFAGTNITVNTSVGTGASSDSQYINLSVDAPVTGAIAALGNTASSNAFGSGSVMFSGSNITVNLSSNGASQWIQLVGADPSAAANEVITTAGGYLSLSIDGVSTLISATGLQPSAGMSDYIKVGGLIFSNSNGFSFGTSGAGSSTTVTGNWGSNLYFQEQYSSNLQHMSLTALSLGTEYASHTHGSNISFGNTSNSTETAIRASSSSNGVTLVVPSYLTTAANSTHIHGGTAYTSNTNLYSPAITGGIGVTSASSGWSVSLPPYLTTAAGVSHSHGNPTLSLSNLSGATASASNGLTISITGYPASSFINTSEAGNLYFVNSLGSNLTWGSSSTSNSTYMYATASGGGAGTGFSSGSTSDGTEIKGTLNSNGLSIVYPAYLTTGGAGGGLGAFELSGNTSGSTTVSGSTVQLYGGNNITLSGYDGSKIRIDGAQGSVYFSDGNGISFGSSTSGISTTITGSIEASLLTLSNYAGIQSTGITGGSATINSSQVLINVPSQTGQIISASNGSYTFSVLSFGTENNVTFYTSEAAGFPSIVASISAGGGPLVSYSGTIDVTDAIISISAGAYHQILYGNDILSYNTTEDQTRIELLINNGNLALEQDYLSYNSDSSIITRQHGHIDVNEDDLAFFVGEYSFHTSNPNLNSSSQTVGVVLNLNEGLHYSGNITNLNNYSDWTTHDNWIPNKQYVDDQISTITAGGGGNWELEGTKTAGTTASAFDTLFLQGGNNITLSGNSNTIVFSVADAADQSQQPMYYSGSNGESSASTITFGNANNLSYYISNGSVVGSFNSSLRQYVYGNTAGVSSQSATNIAFKGGSNITLSIGTDKQIEIIGAAGGGGNQTLSVLNGLWTYTGYDNSASISNELYYRGFGLMSMAFDPTEPSINFIVDEEHLPKFVASNNSHTGRGEIYFANSNGISFGLSGGTGTNSYNATITASVIAGSGGGGVAISASNSSVSGGTVVFSNSNNVNFGLNGSTITASATGLALAGHTHGGTSLVSSATSNSTENLMRFVSASDGLTFIQPAFLTTAMASNESHIRRIAVSGSNYESGSVEISGSRNVTVTYNASTISIYGPANILNSFSVSGNTGTTGSSAISGGGFVIAGGSNITLSQSNNSISIHGATANGPASVVFSDGNGISWGSSSSGSTTTVNATVVGGGVALGNTATIPFTSGSVMLSGVNLTVNTSSTGASQYLQISAPAIGYLYFSNTNGHSWSSSTSGVSTSIYIIT